MGHPAENRYPKTKLNSGIDPVSFYGPSAHLPHQDLEDAGKIILLPENLREFCTLFAPSTEWKTFRKQQQVLDFVSTNNCDLLPFTYQADNGDRFFLAAHPIPFWRVDEQRPLHERHTYEIIREFKPCKLYFDLEFNIDVNPDRNGHSMVQIFINFICAALKRKFDLACDVKDVLNLDSTSETKFSCHLIFPNVIFENNYSVGYFVKQLCFEFKSMDSSNCSDLLDNTAENRDLIEKLFVNTDKSRHTIFCDEGVYTKNRHFRLYKSSKYGKNIALRLSQHNSFPVEEKDEESIFLSSLITYCDTPTSQLLNFEVSGPAMNLYSNSRFPRTHNAECLPSSPYSDIDNCINDLVSPGRIYKSTFFADKKIIVYDIVGNRFCHNIGREHKSNNIMYVVNMNNLTYYQKCYDPDCSNFKSENKKLPITEDFFIKYNIDDELVLAAVQQCEMALNMKEVPSVHDAHSNMHGSDGRRYEENADANTAKDDEILAAVAEQCELFVSITDEWDPITS